jgi:hypothetical protein
MDSTTSTENKRSGPLDCVMCDKCKNDIPFGVIDEGMHLPNGDIAILENCAVVIKQTKQAYIPGCACCEIQFRDKYKLPVTLMAVYMALQNL